MASPSGNIDFGTITLAPSFSALLITVSMSLTSMKSCTVLLSAAGAGQTPPSIDLSSLLLSSRNPSR